MSVDRGHLPVYNFCCKNLRNLNEYYQEMVTYLRFKSSRVQELLDKRIDQDIYIQVLKEAQYIVQEFHEAFREVEQEKDISPKPRVIVAGFKDKTIVEKLVRTNSDIDESSFLVLFVRNDSDSLENISFCNNIRTVYTTKEKLLDDVNDIIEKWACDVAKLMCDEIKIVRSALKTSPESTANKKSKKLLQQDHFYLVHVYY